MNKFILKCLIAELLIIVAVGLVFHFISDRITAGRIAGTIFMALGATIVFKGIKDLEIRKSYFFKVGCVHFFIAVTLFITRLLQSTGAFADVTVLGMSGPVYHKLSTNVYTVLILATVYDLYRSFKNASLVETKK
jgi:hypothetical protein